MHIIWFWLKSVKQRWPRRPRLSANCIMHANYYYYQQNFVQVFARSNKLCAIIIHSFDLASPIRSPNSLVRWSANNLWNHRCMARTPTIKSNKYIRRASRVYLNAIHLHVNQIYIYRKKRMRTYNLLLVLDNWITGQFRDLVYSECISQSATTQLQALAHIQCPRTNRTEIHAEKKPLSLFARTIRR